MALETDHLDRLLDAMAELEDAARSNIDRSIQIQHRIHRIRDQIQAGTPLLEVVRGEEEPRIVELLSETATTLNTVGAELRAAKALALRAEGLTIDSIAELFGVSRQRISALLRQPSASPLKS
ncbi:MAG: hypothetical protein IH940_08845 [Acidobacteria bacterium]|nr:hypothetical protein [Acidobacteriota bacterium]